jgi:hypothetical protein
MDVDDDLKSFATQAAAAQSSPVPEAPQPEKATLPVPEPKPDPAAEENPPQPVFTQPPSSGISASAAGMDGFFNVEGAASDAEGEVGLSGIDKVEINGIVDDESLPAGNESEQTVGTTVAAEMETAEPADTASRGDGPLELGADVEFEIPLVIKPVLQAEKTADSRPSATPPEPVEDAPFKTAEPKKPKAKTPPRVVSNVATSSLADIYLRQGHKEQALAVYKKMLEQKPDNKRILAKIEKLEKELENED